MTENAASTGASADRGLAAPDEDGARPVIRPLLGLLPDSPSGQVCGPDGCAPAN